MRFKLILVRHALDGDKKQSEILAEKINKIVGSDEVTIWTSPTRAALATAEVLETKIEFANKRRIFSKLQSGEKYVADFAWLAKNLVNFHDRGPLVIVSHAEYVRYFPEILHFAANDASFGEAVLIEHKTCRKL